jgi:hypothetical protein
MNGPNRGYCCPKKDSWDSLLLWGGSTLIERVDKGFPWPAQTETILPVHVQMQLDLSSMCLVLACCLFIALMTEAVHTSETSVYSETTWHCIPKALIFILATLRTWNLTICWEFVQYFWHGNTFSVNCKTHAILTNYQNSNLYSNGTFVFPVESDCAVLSVYGWLTYIIKLWFKFLAVNVVR